MTMVAPSYRAQWCQLRLLRYVSSSNHTDGTEPLGYEALWQPRFVCRLQQHTDGTDPLGDEAPT